MANLSLLLLWACVVAGLNLSEATAQSVCKGMKRVVEAGIQDRPPFSSLRLHKLPGAVCDVDDSHSHGVYFECFWRVDPQDLDEAEQEQIVKRFAGSINSCIENRALDKVSWRPWRERSGRWSVRGRGSGVLIVIDVEFGHKGLLERYEGDYTEGVLLDVYSTRQK